jgi:hypothetical protein
MLIFAKTDIHISKISFAMKRYIFLLLFVFSGINAMAQEFSQNSLDKKPIDIRGSKVYVDGHKLDKYSAAAYFSSLDGVDRSYDYLKYRRGYKTGLGLTIGGAAMVPVGYGMFLGGFLWAWTSGTTAGVYAGEATMFIGITSMVAGTACFIAGIPTLCIYKTRLNRLEKKYNTSLQIGTSSNGLSLAISF